MKTKNDILKKAIEETLKNFKTNTYQQNEFPKVMEDIFSKKEEFMKDGRILKKLIGRYIHANDYDDAEFIYFALIRAGWEIYIMNSSDTMLEIRNRHVELSDGRESQIFKERLA